MGAEITENTEEMMRLRVGEPKGKSWTPQMVQIVVGTSA
jgi:hypothetical protein